MSTRRYSASPSPREVDGLGEQRLPQLPVDGGDRHPLTEDLAGRGERVAVAVLDELGDPLARQLHDQTAGLVVVGRQEPSGQPHTGVAHHRGPADGRVVEQVVGELVVEVAGDPSPPDCSDGDVPFASRAIRPPAG